MDNPGRDVKRAPIGQPFNLPSPANISSLQKPKPPMQKFNANGTEEDPEAAAMEQDKLVHKQDVEEDEKEDANAEAVAEVAKQTAKAEAKRKAEIIVKDLPLGGAKAGQELSTAEKAEQKKEDLVLEKEKEEVTAEKSKMQKAL